MALPTLTVLLDDGTGTFPTNISAKVMALDGYEITRGRDDWQGAATAGELNLTLNNSDGRFTPGSTVLGTPSPITVDQRIRLKETVNGVTYTRYTGYVKSWPVSWPATVVTFSTVQITATDAQARAERRTLRSMLEEETLLLSPTAYYTLAEPDGSTSAGDTSGNAQPSLTTAGTGAPVTFGNGTGPIDGSPAVTFAAGQWLSGSIPSLGAAVATGAVSVWFATSTVPTPLTGATVALVNNVAVEINNSGLLVGSGWGTLAGATTSVTDGLTHHAVLTCDGTTVRLYLDGALNGSTGFGGTDGSTLVVVGQDLTGAGSHVAYYPANLSAADVSDIYNAGAGFTETADARLTRLAGYAAIVVGTLDASTTTVPVADTSGNSAMQAMQDVADADLGLAFIDGNGALAFHNRSDVAGKAAPDLTLDRQWVTPDVQPVVDDQRIINYSEVTAAGTGGTQLVRDSTSEDTHGRYPDSRTYLVQTDAEAFDRATWIVDNFAEPTPRYGTLTINLYAMTVAMASTVLAALDLNCWLRVTSLASQTPGSTTADVVVQGWRESVTAESWTITCNVVARSIYNAWILGDSTYGVLGSTTKLYV